MSLRSHLLAAFILLASSAAVGQYYDTGEDPAKLRWMQIKTGSFRVIYPTTYGKEGIKFAAALEDSYSKLATLYNVRKVKMPVIIHNHTTFSNGYVAWAPRRMEIYPTPEQGSIPLENNMQLTLHEGAHVMQMYSINKGFTKGMNLFFGEQFTGIVTALVPLWYLEGDAVFTETFFSGSGRGRSASFEKQLKAIAVERGRMYKYDRLVNGSYRLFIPDHYRSGYQAMAYTYSKYNIDTWNKALKTVANAPYSVDPVNLSLLKNTGHTKRGIMREAFDTLSSIWKNELTLSGAAPYNSVSPEKGKKYINYYSPRKVAENSYVAIKTSLSDPARFVLINTAEKTEHRIHTPGRIYPYYLSAARRVIIWVETQPDPRWDNRDYSVIKSMDLRDNSIKQLTWKTRYMSAAISPDGKMIAAVENTVENINNLVLLNSVSGGIIATYPAPRNAYLQRPQWSHDGSLITLITLEPEGESIVAFNPAGKSWKTLIGPDRDDYQSSFMRNDSLFFISSASGTENLYVLTPGGMVSRLTNSRFGATDVFIDGGRAIFSDYTISGNNICSAPVGSGTAVKTPSDSTSFRMIDQVRQEKQADAADQAEKYTPEKYRKWQHLFKFHSWMPFYADLDEVKSDPTSITPGFTIMSQNHLSTLITSLGYEYTDKLHKFHSKITWKGWYPVFEARIDYGHEPDIYKLGSNVGNPEEIKPGTYYTNTLYLPLTFSTGKYTQFLRPSVSAVYQNNYIYLKEDDAYDYGQTQFSGRLYFSNYQLSAYRDIYPRLAQVIDLNYSFYPFDRDIYGNALTLRTALYFPGFFRNNGIKLRYENDIQQFNQLIQFNRINFPRGYKNIISEELNFLSADYATPLLYPDFNISSLFYLTRIRAGFFYDYASGRNNYYFREENGSLVLVSHREYNENFSSAGVQLLADFYLLRLPYMISAGAQAAWTRGSKTPVYEMIFNIEINGMNIGRSRSPRL